MPKFILQLLTLLTPFGAFVWWVQGPVQHKLNTGDQPLHGILLLLAGILILVTIETLLLKFWLIPQWAYSLSERFIAGNYFPENDRLDTLARRITTEHRPDLIPELAQLTAADAKRVHGWLTLARIVTDIQHTPLQAADYLLQGARAVKSPEDTALLLWRAAKLYQKTPEHAHKATPLYSELIERYPTTTYGRLALTHHH